MRKRVVREELLLVLVVACAGGAALAQTPKPSAPPWFRPAPGHILERSIAERSEGRLPLGFLPNPFQSPTLAPGIVPSAARALRAPASFDSRPSRATSVKDQGGYGTCWLFAGIGDLESKVKIVETPSPDPDYAEWDVVEGLAEGGTKDTGGHPLQVCNHLSKYATIREVDNPYQTYPTYPSPQPIANYWNSPKGTPGKNVVEWHNLGDLTGTGGNVTTIKNFVQDVGPLATAFSVGAVNTWAMSGSGPGVAFSTFSWDSDWVIPYLTATSVDHAILIIGWDDNKAWYGGGGNGAWLVKNSWGTNWGNGGDGSVDKGYFWIAYGSAGMGAAASIYPQDGWQSYDSNITQMYYDSFGCFGQYGWSSQYTVYLCNRFTPTFTGQMELASVDFWANYQNLSYEVKVFDDWNTSYPYTPLNQLGSTETGSCTNAGFYSVPLSTPISLTSGDEICVQVKLTDGSNSYSYLLPVETNPGWFQNPVTRETNKCYARYDETMSWANMSGTGDLGIRIRYKPKSEPVASLSSATYSAAEGTATVTVTVNLDAAPATSCSVDYATSNATATAGQDYTAANGTLTFTSSDMSKTFDVTIIDDGTFDEGAETFTVTLSNPSSCTLGTPSAATVTITDNDTSASLSTVYVNFSWTGDEQGTQPKPYNTFAKGLTAVSTGGTIKIKGDAADTVSSWTGTINTAMIIQADPAGPVRIGVIGGGSSPPARAGGSGRSDTGAMGGSALDHLLASLARSAGAGGAVSERSESLVRSGNVYEPVLPLTTAGDGMQAAQADSVLAVRLRSEGDIAPDSIWAPVTATTSGTSVEWRPIQEGNMRDLWVIVRPQESWLLEDLIRVVVSAQTITGNVVGPVAHHFRVESAEQAEARAVRPADLVWQPEAGVDYEVTDDSTASGTATLTPVGEAAPSVAGGLESPLAVGPERVYETPQRVWLPVPAGVDAASVRLYYYHPNGDDRGWYPAENVEGWLVPESYLTVEVNGTTYLGFLVRHAGIVQLGLPK